MSERNKLFDGWAERYDDGLKDAAGFPFEGYEWVLEGPGCSTSGREPEL